MGYMIIKIMKERQSDNVTIGLLLDVFSLSRVELLKSII